MPGNMGFWYQNADLGPIAPCTTSPGSPPKFDTATIDPDNRIDWRAESHHGDQPDAVRVNYTCKRRRRARRLGELSWNASTKVLIDQGNDLHRRQRTIDARAATRPDTRGEATIVALGNVRDEELEDLRHSCG